jgi:hypothetical protein
VTVTGIANDTWQTKTFTGNNDFVGIYGIRITPNQGVWVAWDTLVIDKPRNASSDTAPTLAATGATTTYTEDGSAVDLFSAVTAATNDSGQTFSGMTLTVTNVSDTTEYLGISGTDVALTNGASGSIGGVGSYSVSTSSGTATVTLSSMSLSDASMGTLVDGLTYRDSSQTPSTGSSRVVTITGITDSGSSSNTASPNRAATVSVAAVNDAPTFTGLNGTPTFTLSGSAVVLDADVTAADVELGALNSGSGNWSGATLTIARNGGANANDVFSDGGSLSTLTQGGNLTVSSTTIGTVTTNGSDRPERRHLYADHGQRRDHQRHVVLRHAERGGQAGRKRPAEQGRRIRRQRHHLQPRRRGELGGGGRFRGHRRRCHRQRRERQQRDGPDHHQRHL